MPLLVRARSFLRWTVDRNVKHMEEWMASDLVEDQVLVLTFPIWFSCGRNMGSDFLWGHASHASLKTQDNPSAVLGSSMQPHMLRRLFFSTDMAQVLWQPNRLVSRHP